MAKLSIQKGKTSQLVQVFIRDNSVATGVGLAGLAYNSAGLTAYYYREGAASAVAITLATMTLGTWATGGFVVVDGTNMPGVYQLALPDAAIASGANSVVVLLKGATNMEPCVLEIELTGWDNRDSVRGGLTALPNANAAANGGLPTVDASNTILIRGGIKKNTALSAYEFSLVDFSGVPRTGLSVTAQRSIDGAAFGACANSVSELSNGIYKIDLAAGDVNGRVITLRFTATGAQDRLVTLVTVD